MFGGAKLGPLRLCLCLVVVLLSPLVGAPAAAAAAEPKPPRAIEVTFKLPESNGFKTSFGATEGRGEHGSTLTFDDERGFVSYSVRPELITKRRVEIDYGTLGRISLRFKPNKKQTGKCDVKDGTFRGEIRFEADGGFASVDEVRAEGQVGRPPPIGFCIPGLTDREVARPSPYVLAAGGRSDRSALFSCDPEAGYGYLAISGLFSAKGATHFGVSRTRIGPVTVDRSAYADGSAKTLRVADNGQTATARPPRPFTGTARLNSGRLMGDLAVPFPGLAAPLRLTPAVAGASPGFGHRCDALFLPPDSGADIFATGGR